MKQSSFRAFSLMELLVVVTIVLVVLAVLAPAVDTALSATRAVTCAANERAWGQALMGYGTSSQMSYPYNGQAIAGLVPIGGHNVTWNSSTVQDFWRQYLAPNFDASRDERHDVLNCPTRQWQTLDELDLGLAAMLGLGDGLSGYFYLPHRYVFSIDYTPAGNEWISRTKIGRGNTRLPIMMDVKQSDTSGSWLVNGRAVSSHADKEGVSAGGNFLYEDGGVHWINTDKIELGATMPGWNFWYRVM